MRRGTEGARKGACAQHGTDDGAPTSDDPVLCLPNDSAGSRRPPSRELRGIVQGYGAAGLPRDGRALANGFSMCDHTSMSPDRESGTQPRPGVKLEPLHLLEDEPVAGHWRDELKLEPFARIVAGAAVGTRGPFTIGVFADWGQGKTSILRQARSLIRDCPDHQDIVTVWFNAWQFERVDHPIVPLIASIVAAVEETRARAEADAAISRRIGEPGKKGLALVSRALRAMAYGFSAKANVAVPGFGDVEAGFVAKEMIERYEKLGAKAEADPLLMRSLYFDAFELLERATDGDGRGDGPESPWRPKIVVFVDDLDRCMRTRRCCRWRGSSWRSRSAASSSS